MTKPKTTPTIFETLRGFPLHEIDRYANLKPNKAKLNERWGEGGWDRNKVVDLMLERQAAKAESAAAGIVKGLTQVRDRSKVLGAKLATYRQSFPTVTPNDEVLLQQLCEIEIQMDELTTDAAAAANSEDGDTIEDKGKRGALRIKLVGEHRRIQNELGIARAQRQDDIDAAQTVAGMTKAAKEMILERAIMIKCSKCAGAHAINQGLILFHFAKHVPYEWRSTCPNCGTIISYKGKVAVAQSVMQVVEPDPEADVLIPIGESDDQEEGKPNPAGASL